MVGQSAGVKALTVSPGVQGSAALEDVPEPDPAEGEVLVQGLEVGICGTDLEIMSGNYSAAPPASDRLVMGHESLGRVLDAPGSAGLAEGDLVVGIVRRPDPVPCGACAVGEWDMCRNGRYTEHGIKGLHGFARERWRVHPDELVRLDPELRDVGVLMEPTTIVAKAWEQVERIGGRAFWDPHTLLVTGAGPVGLLAALLATSRGLEVHVVDQVTDGPKPELVRALGATYHAGKVDSAGLDADVILECTGVAQVVADAMVHSAPAGIVCLLGVSPVGHPHMLDLGEVNRDIVLRNDVIFGSVNANRRHHEAAIAELTRADRSWLRRLISRRVPLADFASALDRRPDDVKVVLDIGADGSGS
jgi:threonine dehydrogenase-like Zn-dependent dehydrogenase